MAIQPLNIPTGPDLIAATARNSFVDFSPLAKAFEYRDLMAQRERENEFRNRQLAFEEQRVGFDAAKAQREAAREPYELKLLDQKYRTGDAELGLIPKKGGLLDAQAYQARRHGDYYDTMGGVARQRADISGDRAQTERTRLIADTLARFGADPTPDVWARENQPGGFIHARFGGPVPYEQRGPVLTQLRERSNMPSDEVEMLDLGFTSDDIRSMKRQRVLDAFKVPKDTAGERQGAIIAQQGLRNLDDAEKLLKDASWWEQLAGDRWTLPGTKDTKIGGFGDAGRGFKSAEMAILDLNFALSGKSVSNAERDKFAELYMPRSTDSRETQAFKLNKVREFFGVVLEARKKGMRDEQIGELYQRAILDGQRGSQPQQSAPQRQQPAPRSNPYKDRYGLD